MKKRSSLFFMLSLTIFATSTLYGAPKKKSKGYLSSFSMPSLSSLNPFEGSSKQQVVLNSDQNQKPRKKKKQKSGVASKLSTKLSGMGSALMGAPCAMVHSRMAKRLAKNVTSAGKDVFAVGPNTIKYVSSKKGKQQIKSALKTGLYYGIPVVGCIGGFKFLADRQQQSLLELRDQLAQQNQQNQQVQQLQQENQRLHQEGRAGDEQLRNDIAQVNHDVQNVSGDVQQVSQRTQDTYTSLRRVEASLDPLQRRTNQTATGAQIIDLHGTMGQMRLDIVASLNQVCTSLNQKAALRGITQADWDDANIEQNFKNFCDTGKIGMLSDPASDLRKCDYLSKYEEVNRVVLVNGREGKPYLCVSFNISKEGWMGGTVEEEWVGKKEAFKSDIKDMFVMPNETHVVLVARDQKTKNWFN